MSKKFDPKNLPQRLDDVKLTKKEIRELNSIAEHGLDLMWNKFYDRIDITEPLINRFPDDWYENDELYDDNIREKIDGLIMEKIQECMAIQLVGEDDLIKLAFRLLEHKNYSAVLVDKRAFIIKKDFDKILDKE